MPRKLLPQPKSLIRQPIPGAPPDHSTDLAFQATASQITTLTKAVNSLQNYPYAIPNRVVASYTVSLSDVGVWATGSGLTVTLLPASSVANGWSVFVKNNNQATTLTVAAPVGSTIDGASTVTLQQTGTAPSGAWFVSDGVSNWSFIL